jgi:hypothetical protein
MSAMRPLFIAAMITSTLSSADGCRGPSQARLARWAQDSSIYEAQLSRWHHDSVVIDSLSRSVPMDSLYRLRRAMLTATSPVDYVPLIMCAREDLLWRYGTRPFEVAQKRLNDTLWKNSEEADVKAMWERVPKSGAITIDNEKCGLLRRSDHAPDSVDGVSLESQPLRPVPPKRP